MSDSAGFRSSIRGIALALGTVLLTVAIGLFGFTDLPASLGIGPSATGVVDSNGGTGARGAGESAKAATGHDDPVDDHSGHDHSGHDHSGHDHSAHSDAGEDGHSQEMSIELSQQARGNLGLQTEVVATSTYTQYVSMPATIVDWPGRTHVSVTASLTGVVNAIYVSRGELIRSGQPLFTLRLTHQDLVKTQSDFLAALGRMDVEQREITRLTAITRSGAVAGKALIEHEYERDRLLAEVRAERQAMLLHGLSEDQIARIEERRELVREVTVYAPTLHADYSLHHESESQDPPLPPEVIPPVSEVQQTAFATMPESEPHQHVEAEFLVTELGVNRGQSVNAGQLLGQLSDYSEVLIEGHAFQKDGMALRMAAKFQFPLQAVIDSASDRPEIVDGLRIAYIGNEIGINSRVLPFFVPLENKIERSEQRGQQRYVSWRFKPGQRLQLRVPLQGFDDTIVVPKDAVAEEGSERYVFVDHGDHFERRPVRVLARDSLLVAIKNDGSIRSGQTIAVTGAHQLQMAMKNKSGGPIDPHAGHNH